MRKETIDIKNQLMFEKKILLCIGGIFVLVGAFFLILWLVLSLHHRKILNEGNRAMAEITGKRTRRKTTSGRSQRKYTSRKIYYTFKTENGEVISGISAMRKEYYERLIIGDSIEIAYDKEKPKNNLPVEGRTGSGMAMSVVVISISSIVIFMGGWLLYYSSKKSTFNKLLQKRLSQAGKC
jgi:hypothetical protein